MISHTLCYDTKDAEKQAEKLEMHGWTVFSITPVVEEVSYRGEHWECLETTKTIWHIWARRDD